MVFSCDLSFSLPVSVSLSLLSCILFSFQPSPNGKGCRKTAMFTRSSLDTPKSNKVQEVLSKQCDVPHNAFDACGAAETIGGLQFRCVLAL